MDDSRLEEIAEADAHATWIVSEHAKNVRDGRRSRCTICEQWWPCDLAALAALAILRTQERDRVRERLRIVTEEALIATEQLLTFSKQRQERYPGEMGTFAEDALIRMSVVE